MYSAYLWRGSVDPPLPGIHLLRARADVRYTVLYMDMLQSLWIRGKSLIVDKDDAAQT